MENNLVLLILIIVIVFLLMQKNERFENQIYNYDLYNLDRKNRCDFQSQTLQEVNTMATNKLCDQRNNDKDTSVDTNNNRYHCRDIDDMQIMLENEKNTVCDCDVNVAEEDKVPGNFDKYQLQQAII